MKELYDGLNERNNNKPMPSKSHKAGNEAKRVPLDVKRLVLHESGYKCSNPACRYPLTLDVHHLYYVSKGGSNSADNLLPLCPNCHTEHHNGNIPTDSLRAWKMLLVTMNEAFDRRAIDLLIVIDRIGFVYGIDANGLADYASLVASNLVNLETGYNHGQWTVLSGVKGYVASLTDKGKAFIDAWKKGDQKAAIEFNTFN
jgi:hypothetical protein